MSLNLLSSQDKNRRRLPTNFSSVNHVTLQTESRSRGYDESAYIPHDFLNGSLENIFTNHQRTPAESTGSHRPHASTSGIPYEANTREIFPLNPDPLRGGLLRTSSQIITNFDNRENVRNLTMIPNLITGSTGSHFPHASTSPIPYRANTGGMPSFNPDTSRGGFLRPSSQIITNFDNRENVRKPAGITNLITESTGSHRPHASTSEIPYRANTRGIPSSNSDPLRRGLLRPSSQIIADFDNRENIRNHPEIENLIEAIQRVWLVCRNETCECRLSRFGSEPPTDQAKFSVSIRMRRDLNHPSSYASIPVLIQSNRGYPGNNHLAAPSRLADQSALAPTDFFEIFHSAIEHVRVEGLRPDLIPILIAYFDSRGRSAHCMVKRFKPARFIIVGRYQGQRHEIQIDTREPVIILEDLTFSA